MPVVAAAAIVTGGTLLASNQANKATDKAISAQNAGTDKSLAAQQAALAQITALNQPFVNAGATALPSLISRVAGGAPNFSSPSYAQPFPGGNGQGVGFGGPRQPAPGGMGSPAPVGQPNGSTVGAPYAGGPSPYSSPSLHPDTPLAATPTATGTPQTTGPDWKAYEAANPDIVKFYNDNPEQQQGFGSLDAFAASQYQTSGKDEGRALPVLTAPPPPPPQQPQDLGTASPVVAHYQRPDQPTAPTYTDPTFGPAPTFTAPTFGASPDQASFFDQSQFQTSPDYQWRLNEGLRNTNASFGAKGLLQSGAALQGFNDYAAGSASQEFGQWFNRQQQKFLDASNAFNADRASGLGQYNADRTSGLGQYNTDRSTTLNQFNQNRATGLTQYNNYRNVFNANFADDRSYGTNLAQNNRDFANAQFSTGTQNLFQLAGLGLQGAGAVSGANNTYANNAQNLFTGQGNNAASAAYSQGATNGQAINAAAGQVANLFSSPARTSTPIPLQTSYGSGLIPGSGLAPNGGNASFTNPLPTHTYGPI